MPPEAALSAEDPSHHTGFETETDERRLPTESRKTSPLFEFFGEPVNSPVNSAFRTLANR